MKRTHKELTHTYTYYAIDLPTKPILSLDPFCGARARDHSNAHSGDPDTERLSVVSASSLDFRQGRKRGVVNRNYMAKEEEQRVQGMVLGLLHSCRKRMLPRT